MFSNVLETKCLENAVILAVYWRKEFAHPTTSGKKRREPNSCRTNDRQPSASCDAHFARRSGAEAQTANGCVRHKLSFGRVQLHGNSAPNDMCFRLAFSPVLCAMDLCRVFYAIMPRGYRDCMFRSEWLKDAKFKSLVGSDWLLNMIGKAKAKALQLESESARLSQTHGVSDTDSGTDNGYAVSSVLPRIEKGHGAAWGKRALLFAKLHFKGTFAHVIIFWGHIAQIVGNTSYVWNVT